MRKYKTQMKVEKLKRQSKLTTDIAVSSFMRTVSHDSTIQVAMLVGLGQGLKYKGDFKRGAIAAATTVVVFASVDSVRNVAANWEVIKNA